MCPFHDPSIMRGARSVVGAFVICDCVEVVRIPQRRCAVWSYGDISAERRHCDKAAMTCIYFIPFLSLYVSLMPAV